MCNDNASCNINALNQPKFGSTKLGFVRQDHGQMREDASMTFVLSRHYIPRHNNTAIKLFPDHL